MYQIVFQWYAMLGVQCVYEAYADVILKVFTSLFTQIISLGVTLNIMCIYKLRHREAIDRNGITGSKRIGIGPERNELTGSLIGTGTNRTEIIGTDIRFCPIPPGWNRSEPGWNGMTHIVVSKNDFFELRKYDFYFLFL